MILGCSPVHFKKTLRWVPPDPQPPPKEWTRAGAIEQGSCPLSWVPSQAARTGPMAPESLIKARITRKLRPGTKSHSDGRTLQACLRRRPLRRLRPATSFGNGHPLTPTAKDLNPCLDPAVVVGAGCDADPKKPVAGKEKGPWVPKC